MEVKSNSLSQNVSKNKDTLSIEEMQKIIESSRVRITDTIEEPHPALYQVNGAEEIPIATLGNFSVIIGKAKAKKSFLISIVISTAIQDNILVLDQLKGNLLKENFKVLYFDTEQSKNHVYRSLQRICKQSKISIPNNLDVIALRSSKPKEREQVIEYMIKEIPNLGFVVIDGVKDLVTSINDEEQATHITSKLLKWTEEQNIHIMTVLHQNKSDTNARGHLGTELINKAETVLSVTKYEKDGRISIVEPQQCRNKEPLEFAFEINTDGIPVFVKDFHYQKTVTKKTNTDFLLDLEDEEIDILLSAVFSANSEMKYTELLIKIKQVADDKYNHKAGNNKIKDFITALKQKGILTQEKEKAPYKFNGLV